MNDYISRESAIESIATALMQMDDPDAPRRTVEDYMPLAESMIRGVPAVPVREAKRGRWINCGGNIGNYIKCAICGTVYAEPVAHAIYPWNFCPKCGACMDMREDTKT